MKKRNIFIIGLAALTLSSCNDFLDVDSPSKFSQEFIFSDVDEASNMLNGVYQAMCNNNIYGNALYTTFNFNSDVEWSPASNETQQATHSEFKVFDCEADAKSNLSGLWSQMYLTIERANDFIHGAERSDLLKDGDSDLDNEKREAMLQMLGEARVIRDMCYFDLTLLMGDIPFTMHRAYDNEDIVYPIVNRDEIQRQLIEDLKDVAENNLKTSAELQTIERPTKEFAYALIARIALFRAGYSLRHGDNPADLGTMQRPDDYMDYYKIAREYAKKVIDLGTHSLNKSFMQVFVDECQYKMGATEINDDPIFELPFSINVSGNFGYNCGPAFSPGLNDKWGASRGTDIRLNAFLRFQYDREDLRLQTIGYYGYTSGNPTLLNQRYNYCNKWSKLWDPEARMSVDGTGSTGINFPYMRYADVLLMFAEADNEVNGAPSADAINAVKEVRSRAFRGQTAQAAQLDEVENATSHDAFFDIIYKERALEFAGENLRWKDLVRWNVYNKVIYEQFWHYYGIASKDDGLAPDYRTLPKFVYYKTIDNTDPQWDANYPNQTLKQIAFYQNPAYTVNGYAYDNKWVDTSSLSDADREAINDIVQAYGSGWTAATWFNWENSEGYPQADCRLSVRGYINMDEQGSLHPEGMPQYDGVNIPSNLPVLRYILPIPQDAINHSNGKYKNYYGY